MDFFTLFLILFCVFFTIAVLRLIIRRRRLNQMRAQRAGDPDVIVLERPEPTYQYNPYQGGYYQNPPPGQTYSQPYYSPPSSSTPPPAYNPQGYSQPYYYPPNSNNT